MHARIIAETELNRETGRQTDEKERELVRAREKGGGGCTVTAYLYFVS